MSNIETVIPERAASVGNFMVGRLLPFRKRRMVGPFAFIDHMGPVHMKAGENLNVPAHPHIGLSTLTFLFEGNLVHKDSLGTEIEIKPGAVNWMTAGRGVSHSERSPLRLRDQEKTLHGLQIWVALPKELEEMEPSFSHTSEDEIPSWEQNGLQFKLIAGEVLGRKSPVPVHSELFFIEIKSSSKQKINLGNDLFGEIGLYILNGKIYNNEHTYEPRQILVTNDSNLCEFEIEANSTVYVFGGKPFPEERTINWNFVSSDKSLIQKARDDWKAQNFPKVPGETEYVPLPS